MAWAQERGQVVESLSEGLCAGREVLLDGAHNQAGAATLSVALDDLAPLLRPGRPTLVLAIMADKDVDGVIRALAGAAYLELRGATL